MMECTTNILNCRIWMENVKAWSTTTSSVGLLMFQWLTRMNGACCAQRCGSSKMLCEHIQTWYFYVKLIFTKMEKRRLWQWCTRTRQRHGINRGVTGDRDCDTARWGAYHLSSDCATYWIDSVLLGIFPGFNAELGVCSFVTWKELQHNKVRVKLQEILHLWK